MGDIQRASGGRSGQEELDVKLDLSRAGPSAARSLLAAWPLIVPAEARVQLRGKPSDLKVDVAAKLGDSATLNGVGKLELGDAPRLQLDVEGRRLDLRALWPNAPQTSADVDADVGIHTEDGRLVVELGARQEDAADARRG